MSTDPDALWTIDDVSTYLRISTETLYQWRKKRTGPPGRKIGRHLRYDEREVRAWFHEQATQIGA